MLWVARTADQVTHAVEPLDLYERPNPVGLTLTACGVEVYDQAKASSAWRRFSESTGGKPYIGLFLGAGNEVTCRACREHEEHWLDDGLNERGEEVAA